MGLLNHPSHTSHQIPANPLRRNLTHDETEDVVEDEVASSSVRQELESLGVVHGAGLIIDLLRKAGIKSVE